MAYQATLCRLTNLKQHPNADRLQVATALGYFVIVGLETSENTLGVVFPSDGKLSHEMLMANNLYRKDPLTGKEMGGYFEENGRVKSIKLRGSKSEAFWTPITSLAWTGVDLSDLEIEYAKAQERGELVQFDELNGHKVCEKYFTPKTLASLSHGQAKEKTKKAQDFCPEFARHFDTTKLREVVEFYVGGDTLFHISEKLHGTSGRTGFVRWTQKKWYQKILAKIGLYHDGYRYVTGTRKVVYHPDHVEDTGFYAGSTFRKEIHEQFVQAGLQKGEIAYYEIVGYTDTGSLIMGEHPIDKADMKESGIPSKEYKQYGDKMQYTYGCEPGQFDVYIYRIVQDGNDLSYDRMKERASELGFKVVPELGHVQVEETDTAEDIMNKVESLTRGGSVLDQTHIKEGVCLRIDNEVGQPKILKYKGFMFCLFEGIRKNSDDYIDLEEAS